MDESQPNHLDTARSPGDSANITSIDAPARSKLFKFLFFIVLLEPLIVMVILATLGVPWWIIGLVIVLIVTIPAVVFWLIHLLAWRPLMKRFSTQPIRSGAVSKSFQSVAFGPLMRFNNCLTLVADDEHLHIVPFAPLVWVGAKRISLPWNRMNRVQHSRLTGMTKVKIGVQTISGPDWCMRLAPGVEAASTS